MGRPRAVKAGHGVDDVACFTSEIDSWRCCCWTRSAVAGRMNGRRPWMDKWCSSEARLSAGRVSSGDVESDYNMSCQDQGASAVGFLSVLVGRNLATADFLGRFEEGFGWSILPTGFCLSLSEDGRKMSAQSSAIVVAQGSANRLRLNIQEVDEGKASQGIRWSDCQLAVSSPCWVFLYNFFTLARNSGETIAVSARYSGVVMFASGFDVRAPYS